MIKMPESSVKDKKWTADVLRDIKREIIAISSKIGSFDLDRISNYKDFM